ncbi:hypothetical protein V1512DRAFT_199221, partial [Lipomyces arxii]|uniref:uncharacterized protein n=1 Tax=Lipomyces arxii TaxID=56418 RepID=UPI0034CF9709
RYELSFVVPPPSTLSTAAQSVSPPIIVRVQAFAGPLEILPGPLLSSSQSQSSGESNRDYHDASSVHQGLILLLQLARTSSENVSEQPPPVLNGLTVHTPEVFTDPNHSDTSGVVRQFGIFSNYRAAHSGTFNVHVILLRGVELAARIQDEASPVGPQLASISSRIVVVSEQIEQALTLSEQSLIQHFVAQGAAIP